MSQAPCHGDRSEQAGAWARRKCKSQAHANSPRSSMVICCFGEGVQAVVPSPRSQRSAADVTQGAVNWAQMGNPNTNQPQMQAGAQPHRFCQDLARSSVRHGDEVDRAMKRGPFPEPELREHLDEHLTQSEKHARVKLVHHPKRKSRIVPTSCRWSGWQICHAVHSFELQ